jgi:hypothetical protein
MTETLRSAGARVIDLEALSINISLLWSENLIPWLHFQVESANENFEIFEMTNGKSRLLSGFFRRTF